MEVLQSKSFWSSVMVIVVMLITSLVPELKSVETELISALTVIAVALVAGHKGKDVLLAVVEAMVKHSNVQDELYKQDNKTE